MKNRIIILPNEEKKHTVNEQIIKILGNNALTAWQIDKKTTTKSIGNVRGVLSNMVRLGELECVKCPHCDLGRMYKVKK